MQDLAQLGVDLRTSGLLIHVQFVHELAYGGAHVEANRDVDQVVHEDTHRQEGLQ